MLNNILFRLQVRQFFSRPDSKWANEFKISWNDLNNIWNVSTQNYLKSYINFDLKNEVYDTYVNKYIPIKK